MYTQSAMLENGTFVGSRGTMVDVSKRHFSPLEAALQEAIAIMKGEK
jgi:hypothetical protein